MSQDSLDVLADVLQAYLGRIGKTMSFLVESSGRPSSHANALDALQAIHMTTAPAAHQVNLKAAAAAEPTSHRVAPWQDLAIFCFGPKWEGGDGAAGKQGPSATDDGHGWKAPYLEEVPHFPLASENVANPHRMKPHVGLSLHTDDVEEEYSTRELDEIPDSVFTDWGSVGAVGVAAQSKKASQKEEEKKEEAKLADANDEKENGNDENKGGEPPKKKFKVESNTRGDEHSNSKRPPYVASFMPSFPQSMQAGRSIVEPAPILAAPAEDITSVRSSLVDLGQSSQYWGSGWDASVPVGKPHDGASTSAVVAPLGRASNSRVSRILEGSMDVL